MPETAYNAVRADLLPQISAVRYSTVILSLGALLEREFLEAIKHRTCGVNSASTDIQIFFEKKNHLWAIFFFSGRYAWNVDFGGDNFPEDIMMLSEGRFGIDNTFTLSNGMFFFFFSISHRIYFECRGKT